MRDGRFERLKVGLLVLELLLVLVHRLAATGQILLQSLSLVWLDLSKSENASNRR